MYWIKTHRGDAVNLAMATDVALQPPQDSIDLYSVRVYFTCGDAGEALNSSTIGSGTKEEMTALRDRIVSDLLAATAAKWQ